MATIKHINKGIGIFIRQEENKFYFIFEGKTEEEYLTVGPKFKIENIETDDEELYNAILRAMEKPVRSRVRRHYKSIPVTAHGYKRKVDDRTFARVFGKLFSWEKGKRFRGYSYADMVNQVMGTTMKNFFPATYNLGTYVGDCEALFVFFDGQYRDNGGEGYYKNYFRDENTAIEVCDIKNRKDYENVKSHVPTVRFIFRRDPDRVGDEYCCEFVGIFQCQSKDIYEIHYEPATPFDKIHYEGELIYKRYDRFEELWNKIVLLK